MSACGLCMVWTQTTRPAIPPVSGRSHDHISHGGLFTDTQCRWAHFPGATVLRTDPPSTLSPALSGRQVGIMQTSFTNRNSFQAFYQVIASFSYTGIWMTLMLKRQIFETMSCTCPFVPLVCLFACAWVCVCVCVCVCVRACVCVLFNDC